MTLRRRRADAAPTLRRDVGRCRVDAAPGRCARRCAPITLAHRRTVVVDAAPGRCADDFATNRLGPEDRHTAGSFASLPACVCRSSSGPVLGGPDTAPLTAVCTAPAQVNIEGGTQ